MSANIAKTEFYLPHLDSILKSLQKTIFVLTKIEARLSVCHIRINTLWMVFSLLGLLNAKECDIS